MTENPYVRLYHLDVESKTGKAGHYYVASRAKDERHLKLNTGENHPDGVIIYAVCKEDKNKVVLVRQYRYAIDDYIYEFPAGLVETGEDFKTAGIRVFRVVMERTAASICSGAASPTRLAVQISPTPSALVRRSLSPGRPVSLAVKRCGSTQSD